MIDIDNVAVIGGDKRQIAMAESILSDGYNVYTSGFETIELKKGIIKTTTSEAISKCKYVILPLPVLGKDLCLNAPYADEKVKIDDNFARYMYGKKVFCGMAGKLMSTSNIWNDINLYDYSKREEFAINNAVPTAEGAIEIAMHEYSGTINGSRCLVAGFGRIGKVLCRMLEGMGAKVTVSARKTKDLAWINVLGYNSILTSKIGCKNRYDIIFNTIPSMIFDSHTLAKSAGDAIVIDLASSPGGVDFKAAKRLKIKAISALSLPGKVAPKAAGEIIKNTVYNMIEEGQL